MKEPLFGLLAGCAIVGAVAGIFFFFTQISSCNERATFEACVKTCGERGVSTVSGSICSCRDK